MRAAPLSPIPRADTLFEIATVVLLLLWWVDWVVFTNQLRGVEVRMSARLEPFFYPVLALCVVDLVRLGVDLARPYRTRPRVALRLALNVAWPALFVVAFRTDGLIEIAANLRADDGAAVLRTAERVFRGALFVLALISAALVATDIVRLVRR